MRSRGASSITSNSDRNPRHSNIGRWLSGNFTTFELAPEFTSHMAHQVRVELRKRNLPKMVHFPAGLKQIDPNFSHFRALTFCFLRFA
jgi:hypothetical protein